MNYLDEFSCVDAIEIIIVVILLFRFQYMAMADNRQRIMPSPDDRLQGRCQPLAYPEAVRLLNPTNPELKGEVKF